MYTIRPESIKTFIDDNSIRLPRFQRKQVWNAKKNFELCISIFKQFPMGVCILNVEVENGDTTKWLLDGRQRRNAFKQMWDDPENIYEWAKKWTGFKSGAQPQEVEEKFWEQINEYLEEDELEEGDAQSPESLDEPEIDNGGSQLPEPTDSTSKVEEKLDLTKTSLAFLLEIVLLIHNKTTKYSGFTRPFDFTKLISSLPYEVPVPGRGALSSRKLKTFIAEYKSSCADDGIEFRDPSSYKHFMKKRFDLKEPSLSKVEKLIDTNWDKILDRIRILDRIQDLVIQSTIGLIEVNDISATDSQKIFNIINSKGTALTAVEVLSAKPSWNLPVKNPTGAQIDAKNSLYKGIGINYDGIVKWDLPATFLKRLVAFETFVSLPADPSSALDKQLTLGFKLLSGIFEKGVRKENVDKLGRDPNITWELDFEKTVEHLNLVSKMILSTDYFKYFKSWQASLTGILSDAIALNFVLIMYEDWKRKGEPVGGDTKAKQFQKNAVILFDRLVYEYVTRQWRGSSDSKIAKNLATFRSEKVVFDPISETKWKELLTDIFDRNAIDNVKISQKVMTPILYHFYSISTIPGPSTNLGIEVDHVIPQSLFNTSTIPDKEYLQHNLFNLGLLPKHENCSKGNDRLRNIEKEWLRDQVVKYEFIAKKDFEKYSDLKNWPSLKTERSKIFFKAFGEKRNTLLAN